MKKTNNTTIHHQNHPTPHQCHPVSNQCHPVLDTGSRNSRSMDSVVKPRNDVEHLANGFTLIEIMIALFIFAIIAAITTAGLQGVITARDRSAANAKRLQQLQIALTIMQRDIAQAINRPITDSKGQQQAAFTGDALKNYLEFTHGGFINPMAQEKRSTLQRVAYYFRDNKLYRRTWPVLDRPQNTKHHDKVILTRLNSFSFIFYDQKKQQQKFWPLKNTSDNSPLPIAVRVTLDLNKWGRIIRTFKIAVTPNVQTSS